MSNQTESKCCGHCKWMCERSNFNQACPNCPQHWKATPAVSLVCHQDLAQQQREGFESVLPKTGKKESEEVPSNANPWVDVGGMEATLIKSKPSDTIGVKIQLPSTSKNY